MKTARLRVLKIAETKFVLDQFEGLPWAPWTADTDNDASKVVEFAGRLCYQSWQKPNPATATNDGYIRHILESLHFSVIEHAGFSVAITGISRACCYDSDTEVLTTNGWIPWPEVQGNELFGTLNPATNELEYQHATERFNGWYEGPTYRVESEQVDLLVTPNHRMWVQQVDTQAYRRGEEPFRIREAQSIVGKRVRYQKCGVWAGQTPERITIPAVTREFAQVHPDRRAIRTYGPVSFPARPFARFLGYYLAEGCVGSKSIKLTQRPGPTRDKILSTLAELGFSVTQSGQWVTASERMEFRFRCAPLHDFLAALGKGPSKTIPQLVQDWDPETIREFIDAIIDGDGNRHRSNGHEVIYTTSRKMADALQILCIKAGYSANIRVDNRVGFVRRIAATGQEFKNLNPCYTVSILKQSRLYPHVNHNRTGPEAPQWRKFTRFGRDNDGFVPYKGTIHCVKVPNGLLFVRRNGKPVVSGNTHELVRHRHFSYSMLSQRFVNEDDAPVVIPPLFRDDPEARMVFEEHYARTQEAYKKLAEIGTRKLVGMTDKTLRRKRVREAARWVLPNMTETHIVVTGNHRAWREFFEKRGELHVDAEMRQVALTIFKEAAQPTAPALYQDFRIVTETLPTGEEVEVLERDPALLSQKSVVP